MRGLFTFVFVLSGCSLTTDLSSLTSDAGAVDASDATPPAEGGACGAPTQPCCVSNACSGGATCNAQSTCACTTTQTACNGTCTDTTNDPKNCGACGHDCFGGACTASVCQPKTLISGQKLVGHLAVNAKRVVWSRSRGSSQTGGLFAVDLDGSNPATLFESSVYSCGALAIDDNNAYTFCGDGAIHQCSIASCSPSTLTTTTNLREMALDTAGSALYVSIGTVYNQQTGGYIGVVPLSGGSIARVTTNDQPNPGSLALANGNVYWVNSGTYTADAFDLNGGVRRAPMGTAQSDTVLDKEFSGSDYYGLSLDTTTAYYGAGNAREVHSVALIGGSASKFAAEVSATGYPGSVVGDGKYVYWTESSSTGGISRCEKSCIKPVQIVADADAFALAQDATCLYWVSGTGEIKRLAK